MISWNQLHEIFLDFGGKKSDVGAEDFVKVCIVD